MDTNTCNFIQYISRQACAVKTKNWGLSRCTHCDAPNEPGECNWLKLPLLARYGREAWK